MYETVLSLAVCGHAVAGVNGFGDVKTIVRQLIV